MCGVCWVSVECLSRHEFHPQDIPLCIHKHIPKPNTFGSMNFHNEIQFVFIFIMDDPEFLIGRGRFSSPCFVLFDLEMHSKLKAATELWGANRIPEKG